MSNAHKHDVTGFMQAIHSVAFATGVEPGRVRITTEIDSEKGDPSPFFTITVRQVTTSARKNAVRIDAYGYGETVDEAVNGAIQSMASMRERGGGK